MAISEDELALQLELELAKARKRKADLNEIDWDRVGEGAREGTLAGAAGLGATGAYARMRNLGTPTPHTFPVRGGKVRRLGAAVVNALDEIGETAVRNPGVVAATELAGGAGAGAAGALTRELAHDSELPPLAQDVAELGGNVVGGAATGVLPVATLNAVKAALRWGMNDLGMMLGSLPLTGKIMDMIPGVRAWPQGVSAARAEERAANALQNVVADPEAAAAAALSAPEGVTPARATGEPGLMALEGKIAQDDPAFAKAVADDLEAAVQRTQGELRDLYATPRGKQDWELAVVSRGAAPGATIQPGTPLDMLDQAATSFRPLYDAFREWPAKARLLTPTRKTPLATMFDNIAGTRTSMAGDNTRQAVKKWLSGKMSALRRKEGPNGELTTGDLLDLRSDIRGKLREARRSDTTDAGDRAELLSLAEDRVNQVLRTWLPPAEWKRLANVDRQYSVYKTIESAVMRSKNRELTPDNLLAELRYGGAKPGLRSEAMAGRGANELLGKPDLARVVSKQLDPAGLENMKSDFVHTMINKATKDGVVYGNRFSDLLAQNTQVARELGMTHEEIGRLERIASSLKMMQAPSPAVAAKLLNDGPSDLLQLLTTLAGSKVASEITQMTGSRAGALPFAGFMTKYYRRLLNSMTSDQAAVLLADAARNPELFAALLTKRTDPPIKHAQAARVLSAWMYGVATPSAADAVDTGLNDLRETARQFEEQDQE